MEIPSTGPQSLASYVSLSEYQARRGDSSSEEEDESWIRKKWWDLWFAEGDQVWVEETSYKVT